MAKSTVPVNFKDDIMNSSMGGKRRYKMINHSDGTISLEDATTYDQVGSNFGAAQLNATNKAVNAAADAGKIIDDIDAIRNVTKEGYMAGALALKKVDDSLGGINFITEEGKGITGYTLTGADTVFPFNSNNYKLIHSQFSMTYTLTLKIIPTSKTLHFINNGTGWFNTYKSRMTATVNGFDLRNNETVVFNNDGNIVDAIYDVSDYIGDEITFYFNTDSVIAVNWAFLIFFCV